MFLPLRHTLPSGAGGRRAAALNFLAARSGLILCILFLLAGLALAGDYGIAPDEPNQRRTARITWTTYWAGPAALPPRFITTGFMA